MTRRRSLKPASVEGRESPQQRRRPFQGLCGAHSSDVAARAPPAAPPLHEKQSKDGCASPTLPSVTTTTAHSPALHAEECDGVVVLATAPRASHVCPPVAMKTAERPTTMSPARRVGAARRKSTSMPTSEGASPPRRASRTLTAGETSPLLRPPQQPDGAFAAPASPLGRPGSPFTAPFTPLGDGGATLYSYSQPGSQLRALAVPDSRLLLFNTQMTSPVPMLVHGSQQHNFISISGARGYPLPSALPDHFSTPPRLQPAGHAEVRASISSRSLSASPVSPQPRRRSRPSMLVINEPTAQAFARVPPSAPALHFANFTSEPPAIAGHYDHPSYPQHYQHQQQQQMMMAPVLSDGYATPRSVPGSGPTRPASTLSVAASPTIWSATNAPAERSSGVPSSAGASTDLAFPGASLLHSRADSAASASLPSSSSLASYGSHVSFIDQGPMQGGLSPSPLAARAFAPWQSASSSQALDTSITAAAPSILVPQRGSCQTSAEAAMGGSSSSFTTTGMRKKWQETEAAQEVETVANFVARMKAAKRRNDSDTAEPQTPDSGALEDTRGGLTSSNGGSVDVPLTASPGSSAQRVGSARPPVTVSVPSPPPLRIGGDPHTAPCSAGPQGLSLDGPTPATASEPPPAGDTAPAGLNDRDAMSAGSNRSNLSYRKRDVRASVEAALANLTNTSSPAPAAQSRRKSRGMAVNFLLTQ